MIIMSSVLEFDWPLDRDRAGDNRFLKCVQYASKFIYNVYPNFQCVLIFLPPQSEMARLS